METHSPAEETPPVAPPTLSVVMATYNGSAYLPAQLRSLAEQDLLPTELVCFDDASTDGTVALLEAFARTAPFSVRIHARAANVGPNRNFDDAIRLATADVVLCCDQDDVWRPEKLARVAEAFARDAGLGLLLNDAAIVREDLSDAGETLWELWHLDGEQQQRIRDGEAFQVFSQHVPPYGCTMSFRSALVPSVPPVPEGATFDLWFGRLLGVLTRCDVLPEPLQLYRQHADQVTGFETRTVGGKIRALRRQAGTDVLEAGLRRTAQAEEALRAPRFRTERGDAALAWLAERATFDRERSKIRASGFAGLPKLLRLARSGRYTTVSAGWRGAVVDLVGLVERGIGRRSIRRGGAPLP